MRIGIGIGLQSDTGRAASLPLPTLSSASVASDGVTWTITLSQSIVSGHTGFTATNAAGSVSLTYVSTAGAALTFTGSTTTLQGDTPTVSYTPGDVTGAGGALASFSAQAVTNNSTQTLSRANLTLENISGVGYYDATVGGSPVSANGATVRRWEDQSGNANHATDATGMVLLSPTTNSLPGLTANGKKLVTTSLFGSGYNTAFTQILVAYGNGNAKVATGGNGLNLFIMQLLSGQTYQWQFNLNGLSTTAVNGFGPPPGLPAVLSLRYDGSTFRVAVNGYVTAQAATGNLGLSGGLTYGDYSAGGFAYPGQILENRIWQRALTDGQLQAWEQNQCARFGIGWQTFDPLIVFDGNSLTTGVGSTGGQNYPAQVMATEPLNWRSSNTGVAGQTTQEMINRAAAQVDPQFCTLSGQPNQTVVYWEITNSLYYGATAATTYTQQQTYGNARVAAGWGRLVILDCLPRQDVGTPGDFEANRLLVNASLAADFTVATAYPHVWGASPGVTYADYLVKVSENTQLQDPNNTTYFSSDKVHLTNAGYAVVAADVERALSLF